MGNAGFQIGSNDSSVEKLDEDLFDVSKYVNGLADFITACVTPMTISIQGDWGSGKTSMMNMVREALGDKVLTVWFNTWQYSQFNMGDDLTVSFLGKLIQCLQPEKTTSSAKETFKKAYKAIKKAGYITVDHFIGGAAAEELENLAEKFSKGDDDAVDAINSLKEEFKSCVAQKLSEERKDRLVVFIDDLDRLNPGKAVELLEVLKVFLDCEKCIFVLAIDYSVVSQGVKEKYGDLIGEDKGKSFLDKIIQVPFKMPVAHYKVDKFVKEMFKQVNIDLDADGGANEYVSLIQASVGCNPRTMKRLFNAYLLLTFISKNVNLNRLLDDPELGAWYKKMLFGILCCQHAYEDLYNFLVRHHDDFAGSNLLNAMCIADAYFAKEELDDDADDEVDDDKPEYHVLVDTFKNKTEEEIRKIAHFMELFVGIIDRDGNKMLDDKELEGFTELLALTTITTAGNEETIVDDSVRADYRRWSRSVMTKVADVINPIYKERNPDNRVNPVYQVNEDEPDYKKTWADVWTYMYIDNGQQIAFENAIMVNEETRELSLRTWTARRRSFPKNDFVRWCSESKLYKEEGFEWRDKQKGLIKCVAGIGYLSGDEEEQQAVANKVIELIKYYLKLI
jgi:hypothetical protein